MPSTRPEVRLEVPPGSSRSRHKRKQPRPAAGWFIATLSSVTGIAGLSLWAGPAPVMAPWDVFTLLNGAYRIYAGQSPGGSFTNPVGPLVYGLTAIGMHLQGGPSLRSVTYGQVIFLVIAAALAWVVASRRLPAPYAAAFIAFVALLAVAVRPLGYSPWITTYAMLYNRDGWLLYATLLLLALWPASRPASGRMAADLSAGAQPARKWPSADRSAGADGLVAGLILGLLFYDKITFFLAGLVAVALGFALSTLARRVPLAIGAVCGMVVAGAAARLAFGVNTTGYIANLIEAAKVQVASQRAGMLAHTIVWVMPVALAAAVVIGGLLIVDRRFGRPIRPIVRLSIAAAYVLGSSILISAGDASEKGDLPALVVIPLLLVAFLEPRLPRWAGGSAPAMGQRAVPSAGPGAEPSSEPGEGWPAPARRLLLAGLAVLLVGSTGPIVGEDSLALGKAISYHGYDAHPPASQVFDSPALGDFVIPADSQWQTAYRTAHVLPAMINDGLSVLRQNVRPGQSVFTLAYTDPFSMALRLPLSQCGPLWWDLGYDFDSSHHPGAACAIGNAEWVMIPRMIRGQGCCQRTVSVMQQLYSGYLAQHYANFRQTSDWILLRRVH